MIVMIVANKADLVVYLVVFHSIFMKIKLNNMEVK